MFCPMPKVANVPGRTPWVALAWSCRWSHPSKFHNDHLDPDTC
jgi:hypothetical protein